MTMQKNTLDQYVEEREIFNQNGFLMLFIILVAWLATIVTFGLGVKQLATLEQPILFIFSMVVMFPCSLIASFGFHLIRPNEAKVLTLFGKYYGTMKQAGFYYVIPFASAVTAEDSVQDKPSIDIPNTNTGDVKVNLSLIKRKTVSLKTMTLNNQKQKVNDSLGNPIIIGAVVIWKVVNPTKAVFNVKNYSAYLSIQCDSTIRNTALLYPYDNISDECDHDEQTLRGSSVEIADRMREDLQNRVHDAGLEVSEVRITHLSYAEEIAHAMLQRQQAVAVIAARKEIVEGAVGMVKMAVREIDEDELVVLDDERLASMVSNLLVVLCSNKDATPVVNTGSLY